MAQGYKVDEHLECQKREQEHLRMGENQDLNEQNPLLHLLRKLN